MTDVATSDLAHRNALFTGRTQSLKALAQTLLHDQVPSTLVTQAVQGMGGVGKTQLAKVLSRYLFGHGEKSDRLVRLDMSEYQAPGAAGRLLETGEHSGSLSERVRQQPLTLVLLLITFVPDTVTWFPNLILGPD